MPTNKLTIVPVKLNPLTNEMSSNYSPKYQVGPSCVIKTATAEISLYFYKIIFHLLNNYIRIIKKI